MPSQQTRLMPSFLHYLMPFLHSLFSFIVDFPLSKMRRSCFNCWTMLQTIVNFEGIDQFENSPPNKRGAAGGSRPAAECRKGGRMPHRIPALSFIIVCFWTGRIFGGLPQDACDMMRIPPDSAQGVIHVNPG